jgi:hypothetical protein
MTEQVSPTGFDDQETVPTPGDEADIDGRTTTGVAAVDQVLREVETIHDLPLEEQLAAFERGHEALRLALDAPTTGAPTTEPGNPA